MIPEQITSQTDKNLSGTTLNRYEEITKIMVNEYGYEIFEEGVCPIDGYYWKLRKKIVTINNQTMEDDYIVAHHRTLNEICHAAFDHMLPLIKTKKFV